MTASWYLLFVRAEGQERLPKTPMVGERVRHFLGKSEDSEKQTKDSENPLWPKIQDGVRPAWSPDILRLGYTVMWKREGLPKLAVRLGIKNPKKLKEAKGGLPTKSGNGKRVLTFDDAFVVGVQPEKSPFYMPPLSLNDEDWWLESRAMPKVTSPYIAPGGATVVTGMQRLADVVAAMLSTPSGYPRSEPPSVNDPADMSSFDEFDNTLQKVKDLPQADEPQQKVDLQNPVSPSTGGGIDLFRY